MLNYLTRAKIPLRIVNTKQFFSSEREKKYKVIQNPADISKLIFDEKGLCKIYDFKQGEPTLRKIVRYVSILTFVNGTLFAM